MKLSFQLLAVLLICVVPGECLLKLDLRSLTRQLASSGGQGGSSGGAGNGGGPPACPSNQEFKDELLKVAQGMKDFRQKLTDIRDTAKKFYDGYDDTTFQDVADEYATIEAQVQQSFGGLEFLGHYMGCAYRGEGGFARETCSEMIDFAQDEDFEPDKADEYKMAMAENFIDDINCFLTEYSLLEALAEDELSGSGEISKNRALTMLLHFVLELVDFAVNGEDFHEATEQAYHKTLAPGGGSGSQEVQLRELLMNLLKRGQRD